MIRKRQEFVEISKVQQQRPAAGRRSVSAGAEQAAH
jgi:hypothetical protein